MAAMMDERRNSHDGGLPGRPAGATSLSGSLGRYSRDDDALAASIGSSDGGPTPAVRGDTSVAASKPSLSVGSKAKKGGGGGGRRKGGRGSKPDDVLAKAMAGVVFPEDDIALGGLSRKELGLPELGFDQGLLQSMQLPVANKKKKQQPPS